MLTRAVQPLLKRRLSAFPAVALIGPRQSGKTTLAKAFGGAYFDLEQEADLVRLDLKWEELVKGKELLVLDEAHNAPQVFARIRGAIDAQRRRNGRFLILGSISPALMTQVSESLVGRLALVRLTPLLWQELEKPTQRDHLWLYGGFPDGGVLTPNRYPVWQQSYLALLAQRDLPAWGLRAAPQVTERLFAMLAALHGQVWNASDVGRSLALTYPTVNSYLDHLAGAFLIRRLQPFAANIRKRLVKRPKVYWRDSGLLHAILGVRDKDGLLKQPWVGASWEGFVIEQVVGALSSRGRDFSPYYFRTSDGHELDLVMNISGEIWAFEIKLTTSPSVAHLEQLDRVADMIKANRRVLITQTSRPAGDDMTLSCNLAHLLDTLKNW
jgi:uncharacterized protein